MMCNNWFVQFYCFVQIPKNTRTLRAAMSCRLRHALDSADITSQEVERVFLVQLPDDDHHSHHYVGPVCTVFCVTAVCETLHLQLCCPVAMHCVCVMSVAKMIRHSIVKWWWSIYLIMSFLSHTQTLVTCNSYSVFCDCVYISFFSLDASKFPISSYKKFPFCRLQFVHHVFAFL